MKNSSEKIRAETAGQPDSRQQAPPAKPPGKAQRKIRRKWGRASPGGRPRRSGGKTAGKWAEDMQGTPPPLQNRRAEGVYARGIRLIPGLYTAPYSPPGPCKSCPPSLQNPTARATGTADRDNHSQHHRQPAQQSGRHSAAGTAPQRPQLASTTAPQPPQRTPGPQQDGQPSPTATAIGPTMTTGPARSTVGTPGEGSKACGFRSAKYF